MPTSTAATSERRPKGEAETQRHRDTANQIHRVAPSPRLRVATPPTPKLKAGQTGTLDAGFTLLELSLVLLILGVLFTLFVPRLRNVTNTRLTSTAERLATTARYLFAEAAFTGRVYRLHYSLDQRTYGVTVLSRVRDSLEFVPDSALLSRPVTFPPEVAFANVITPSLGTLASGEVFTHFYPQGYADLTVIHLRNQRGRFSTVMIPPLTGEARVYDGYWEPGNENYIK